jgi:D-lyxose ketol-isomerase
MLTTPQIQSARAKAWKMFERISLAMTPDEADRIEVADFGLGDLDRVGLQLLVYVNTDRVCAKELVMFPGQTCPEHYHPSVFGEPGKEETFRCRWGDVYLYVPGETTSEPKGIVPAGYEEYFTAWHEIHLRPGQQYTLLPETRHWFQAGLEGAIVSEFSTRSRDEYDVFTDPRIVRETRIEA